MSEVQVLFLDLDDTLYSRTNGLWNAIGIRIHAYLTDRLGLAPAEAERVRGQYLDEYGTTLSGLMHHHRIDPLDYLRFVHDLRLQDYLSPDPDLRTILHGIEAHKAIFTNAHREHVDRVLELLGVEAEVDQIIDLLALQLVHKPQSAAYRTALHLTGAPAPERCMLVDDRLANLLSARQLGMRTVWVGSGPAGAHQHTVIPDIHDLPAVPGLRFRSALARQDRQGELDSSSS